MPKKRKSILKRTTSVTFSKSEETALIKSLRDEGFSNKMIKQIVRLEKRAKIDSARFNESAPIIEGL